MSRSKFLKVWLLCSSGVWRCNLLPLQGTRSTLLPLESRIAIIFLPVILDAAICHSGFQLALPPTLDSTQPVTRALFRDDLSTGRLKRTQVPLGSASLQRAGPNVSLFCMVHVTATTSLQVLDGPKLGATPAAQVSGGQIPHSTNKEKRALLKHSHSSTSFSY